MRSLSLFGLRLRTGPEALETMRRRLGRRLGRSRSDRDLGTLVLLAVEEVVANVVEHGYRERPGQPISIWVRRIPRGRLEVSVWDRAPEAAFPRTGASLQCLAASRSERGRGQAMVRLLAESVTHRSRETGGNILTLVFDPKRLEERAQEHLREAA
jgi:anti-sigma regulatory factor (Ser/Thr protein kinase)